MCRCGLFGSRSVSAFSWAIDGDPSGAAALVLFDDVAGVGPLDCGVPVADTVDRHSTTPTHTADAGRRIMAPAPADAIGDATWLRPPSEATWPAPIACPPLLSSRSSPAAAPVDSSL